jgi:alkanesulfonate monooxygenase SsuD/methylene tetrahydromethanopterin reductase-like flavin-dependent oxidoreductase (luciferase family)
MPKPVQPGGVPIWCGGRVTSKAARRIARFGAGWITWDVSPEEMASSIEQMRELVAAAGGTRLSFPVQVGVFLQFDADGSPDLRRTFAILPRLAEAGVTDVTLYRVRPPLVVGEAMDFVRAVVAEFRSAVPPAGRAESVPTAPADVRSAR